MEEPKRLRPIRRQAEVLELVKAFNARYGRSPSMGEIAGHFGISRGRAHELVHALAFKRMIEVVHGKAYG
ncbi:hypothetical protein PYV61_26020, partial [Roseisolibacter sp. H3M3-2]